MDDEEMSIQSWVTPNLFYNTVGTSYCSCPAFEHGDGKPCKHLQAKMCKPRVKVSSELKELASYAGQYTYNGMFPFPVWSMIDDKGVEHFLYKGAHYKRWMITNKLLDIANERGFIRTRTQYHDSMSNPGLPPCANNVGVVIMWEIWNRDLQQWKSSAVAVV